VEKNVVVGAKRESAMDRATSATLLERCLPLADETWA